MEANETILYIDLKKLESNFQYFNNLIKSKILLDSLTRSIEIEFLLFSVIL